uniref:RIIa domain-containing protein n=1 Tax=Leptobrachium leishanense TaxID=445787 RepID=A0A8C5QRH6_9ANUR
MSVPFSNTNLRVPRGFGNLLEGLTREVLREQPGDIPLFASKYFETLLKQRQELKFEPAEWGASLDDRFYNNHAFNRAEISAPTSASGGIQNSTWNSMSPLEGAPRTDRSLSSPHVEQKEERAQDLTQGVAATVIQAAYRGHLGRDEAKKLKESAKNNVEESHLVNTESVARDEEAGAHSPDPTEPQLSASPGEGPVTLTDPECPEQEPSAALSDPFPNTACEMSLDETLERKTEHEEHTAESHTIQGDGREKDRDVEDSQPAETQEAGEDQNSETMEGLLPTETPAEEHESDPAEPLSNSPHLIQGDTSEQAAGGDTDPAAISVDNLQMVQEETNNRPAGGDTDLSSETIQGDTGDRTAGGDTNPATTLLDATPKPEDGASEQPAGGDTEPAASLLDAAPKPEDGASEQPAGGDTEPAASLLDAAPKPEDGVSEQPAAGDTFTESNGDIVSSGGKDEDSDKKNTASADLPLSEEETLEEKVT